MHHQLEINPLLQGFPFYLSYSTDKVVFSINWIKSALLIFVLLALAACGEATEDTEDYIGVIASESSMGYAYTVSKEIDSFKWEIGYKDDVVSVEENEQNTQNLDVFRESVGENRVVAFQMGLLIVYLVLLFVLIGIFTWRKPKAVRSYMFLLFVAVGVVAFLLYHSFQDYQRTMETLELVFETIKEG